MTLSTKLIADYSELTNQFLDSIPIEKEEEFEVVKEALLSISKPYENHHVPDSLKDRIGGIKDVLANPDMYVQNEANYLQFKNIILQRVAAKIQEIDTLKPAGKITYIENLKKIRDRAFQDQASMATRKPPEKGSEAHVPDETAYWIASMRSLRGDDRIIASEIFTNVLIKIDNFLKSIFRND